MRTAITAPKDGPRPVGRQDNVLRHEANATNNRKELFLGSEGLGDALKFSARKGSADEISAVLHVSSVLAPRARWRFPVAEVKGPWHHRDLRGVCVVGGARFVPELHAITTRPRHDEHRGSATPPPGSGCSAHLRAIRQP